MGERVDDPGCGDRRFGPDSRLALHGIEFRPALFCAPMAGLTHSAFRRLISDFGGHGALFTEMLCGRWLLKENLENSPSVKRREQEGSVIYQLMLSEAAQVPAVLDRLARANPVGIDLNCACPAWNIRSVGAGSDLFEERDRLAAVVAAVRKGWSGLLTVKLRLGSPREGWRERLNDRFRLFEDEGVDALIIHPRFSNEKLKGRARHELFPELVAATRLPIIANGDIHGPSVVAEHPEHFAAVAGIMVGRMAVVRPWSLREWGGAASTPDYLEVWTRLVRYVCEDFRPERAFYRVKEFTKYFARNFLFGHTLFAAAESSHDLATLEERATRFLAAAPEPVRDPGVLGLA